MACISACIETGYEKDIGHEKKAKQIQTDYTPYDDRVSILRLHRNGDGGDCDRSI